MGIEGGGEGVALAFGLAVRDSVSSSDKMRNRSMGVETPMERGLM